MSLKEEQERLNQKIALKKAELDQLESDRKRIELKLGQEENSALLKAIYSLDGADTLGKLLDIHLVVDPDWNYEAHILLNGAVIGIRLFDQKGRPIES